MRDFLKGMMSTIIVVGFFLLIIGAAIAIPYLIATSDLPDWFKFWLLK